MQILHNPSTLSHSILELVGSRLIPAYESPSRITSILSALSNRVITHCTTDISAALDAAAKVHTAEYLQHLQTIFPQSLEAGLVEASGTLLPECFPSARLPGYKARRKTPTDLSARTGWYAFDLSSGIAEHTYTAALASADLARRGALEIAKGEKTVFVMCRPPGHHCGKDIMGGYCYLNNTAIAVKTLLGELEGHHHHHNHHQQQRHQRNHAQISILDLDFHHGNGTQEVFYADKNPAYVSIHGEGEYPYFSGAPEEKGEGKGLGYNLNLPISCAQDVTWDLYSPRMKQAIQKLKAVKTKYLVVSLGFDTFCNDPVGKFCLAREDYGKMGRIVGELGLPTLVVLEGGYVVEELGNNCAEFLKGLEEGKASAEANAKANAVANAKANAKANATANSKTSTDPDEITDELLNPDTSDTSSDLLDSSSDLTADADTSTEIIDPSEIEVPDEITDEITDIEYEEVETDKQDKTCEWEKVEKSEAVNGSCGNGYINGYGNGYCNAYTVAVNDANGVGNGAGNGNVNGTGNVKR